MALPTTPRREKNAHAALWWFLPGIAAGLLIGTALERARAGRQQPRMAETAPETVLARPRVPTAAPPFRLAGEAPRPRLDRLAAGGGNLRAALATIEELETGEFEPALRTLEQWKGRDRDVLLRALSKRWAEVDLDEASQFMKKARNLDFGRMLLDDLAPKLVQRDPPGALEFLKGFSNPLFQVLTAHAILGELAKVDPDRATQFLSANPHYSRYEDIYRGVARAYAGVAPLAAVEWAGSLQNRKLRKEAERYAWSAWAESDPAGAAAAFRERKTSLGEQDLAAALSAAWSLRDPEATRNWIEALREPRAQDQAWSRFRINVDDFGSGRALELIQSVASERAQATLALSVSSQLAEKDLPQALKWTEQLPPGAARQQALLSLMDRWAPNDPAAAVAYAAAETEGQGRADLLRRTVGIWSLVDSSAALAWIKDRPPGEERSAVAADALRSIKEFDPQRSLAWLDLIDNPGMRNHAAAEVVQEMAKGDGAAAAQFAARLPPEAQPEAFHSVVRGWAFDNPDSAGGWINTLPTGHARDSAIEAYVSVVDGMDAGLATRWAMAIEEPALRNQTVSGAFKRWVLEKPDAAAAWLQNEPQVAALKIPGLLELQQRAQTR